MLKQPNLVRGNKIKCINFQMCPVCYGCRNYNSLDPECAGCMEDKKFNICKTETHRADLVDKLISKNAIEIKKELKFKSF